MIGQELIYDKSLNILDKMYVYLFGAPISGLRIRVRRILPLLKNIKFNKVLDIGCGIGVFSFEIAKRYRHAQVIGMDNNRETIENANFIAQKNGLRNCKFIVGDILTMHLKEDFDLLICIDILEHIKNDQKAIERIYESIKKGTIGIIHVPGYYRRWFFFSKKINYDVKGHIKPGYKLEDIRNKLEKAGFTILEISYTYGLLETVTNNLSYLISHAEKKNKFIYALFFPFMNILAFFGQWERPQWGAGILIKIIK